VARLELSSEGAGGGGDAFITAVAEDGRRLLAKAAVVAVPLPMLVSNDGAAGAEGVECADADGPARAAAPSRLLGFSPALPASKLAAMRSIAVGNALKVSLIFGGAARPWREEAGAPLHALLCAGWPVPEVWARPRHGGANGVVVHGFATGDLADALSARTHEQVVDDFLRQLAAVLPGASLGRLRGALRHSAVTDWSQQPYVSGGYSTVSAGEALGARAAYRAPEWGGRLGFAGEATQDAMMTMSAAIDSGRRAAAEVLAAPLQHQSFT
jgi:monoamine oxidase